MMKSNGKQKRITSEPPVVTRLTPDKAEAHDDGPPLIPQPGTQFTRGYFQHQLPTEAAVALADKALARWAGGKRKK